MECILHIILKKKIVLFYLEIVGEKPLYYTNDSKKILFASNLKYIETILNSKFNLNLKKIANFLAFGFKEFGNNNQTIFKNINFLLPGHTILINHENKKKIKKYVNFEKKSISNFDYHNSAKTLRAQLNKTFKTRFRADVPLTCLLSGGMDSSSIAAIAKKQKKNFLFLIKTFF